MASTILASSSALQAKSFVGKALSSPSARPCPRPFIVRAEDAGKENALTTEQKERLGGNLFFADDDSLSYLDGSRPADYGFDPLGLMDPRGEGGFVSPSWLSYSEVIHARFAMLGAAGMIAPEILASAGVIPQSPQEVTWYKTGVIGVLGKGDQYWMDPYSLFWIEVVLMQFAELKRWQDYKYPGSQGKQYFIGLESVLGGSGNPAYPGGQFFNLFNLGKTPEELQRLKVSELKNGRLAMLAVFGFGAQAVLTGKGPWANLLDHLANPTANNILGNFSFHN